MKQTQIIPLLIFLVIAFFYVWGTTKFQKGWIHRCVPVKGGRLNVLLVIAIIFVVVFALVKATM